MDERLSGEQTGEPGAAAGERRRCRRDAAARQRGKACQHDEKAAGHRYVAGAAQDSDPGQCPQEGCGHRDPAQPGPAPVAHQQQAGAGQQGEVGKEAPGRGVGAADQHGHEIPGERAEQGKGRAMEQGQHDGCPGDGGHDDKGGQRADQAVERMGRPDRGKQARKSGACDRRGHVLRPQRCHRPQQRAPPQPFAGKRQAQAEQHAAEHPLHRAEQALLDRIAHQENSAQGQRHRPGPDHPARG